MTPSAIASGGTISWIDNGNNTWEEIHKFTASGTFTLNKATTARILVVGGGGSGGVDKAGGGGGGGISYATGVSLSAGSYAITVGAGGIASSISSGAGTNMGYQGGNSSFGSLYIGYGGGAGGGNGANGANGGSGGGGASEGGHGSTGGSATKGSGGTTYGNSGGNANSKDYGGGGGGGAGGAGGSSTGINGATGGAGRAFDITGSSVYYGAGGGGAAHWNGSGGNGGTGGGGKGGVAGSSNGSAGTANTGSGGGGGGQNKTSGAGGSGIVIVRLSSIPDAYTITAIAETGGSISPSGSVTVQNGGSQTFTISAASGYQISTITVDGSSIAVADRHSQSYLFTNVTANHSIKATFEDDCHLTVYGYNAKTLYADGIDPRFSLNLDCNGKDLLIDSQEALTVNSTVGYRIEQYVLFSSRGEAQKFWNGQDYSGIPLWFISDIRESIDLTTLMTSRQYWIGIITDTYPNKPSILLRPHRDRYLGDVTYPDVEPTALMGT